MFYLLTEKYFSKKETSSTKIFASKEYSSEEFGFEESNATTSYSNKKYSSETESEAYDRHNKEIFMFRKKSDDIYLWYKTFVS